MTKTHVCDCVLLVMQRQLSCLISERIADLHCVLAEASITLLVCSLYCVAVGLSVGLGVFFVLLIIVVVAAIFVFWYVR